MNFPVADLAALDAVTRNYLYLKQARAFFDKASAGMTKDNHGVHNFEPNYWDFLVADLVTEPIRFAGSRAFEYGCGAGRNLVNMLGLCDFERVDAVDISNGNAASSRKFVEETCGPNKSFTVRGNGYSCQPFQSGAYRFAMSHQVMQHIPNYSVRRMIVKDVFRILEVGGVFACHFMTIGDSVGYFDDYNAFPMNVTPASAEQLYADFTSVGFREVSVSEVPNLWDNSPEWYVRCVK